MSIPPTQKAAWIAQTAELADSIQYSEIETPQITDSHDVIIKNRYSGVNFIDTYFRQGTYPGLVPTQFPYTFGREAAGVVAAVGDGVTAYKVGDPVAYLGEHTHAQYTKLKDSHLLLHVLKSGAEDQLKAWAGGLLQGMTVLTFVGEACGIKHGDYVLVWAAAGGVGRLLTRYATSLGGHVIAVASTDEKLALAKESGAEHLVKLSENVAERVKEITGGAGVAVVFDGVGKDSFESSMAAVGQNGSIVCYGAASGPIPPLNVARLTAKNTKLVRPLVFGYVGTKEKWDHYSALFEKLLSDGSLVVNISKTYPLLDYNQATKDLEERRSTGKLVLEIPQ